MQLEKETTSATLWGVLGTFRGGLGGVEVSEENPLSWPKTEGEYGEFGPDISVLNRNMFLLGLIGDPRPAGEEDPKSDPKSSNLNNLEYASFPPSLTGEEFSISPKVCSLDDDLHGMNLSLHVEDFDFEGDDKFDIVRGDPKFDIVFRGDPKFDIAREDPVKVSRRSDVSDIPAGRFSPVFLAWGESISGSSLIFLLPLRSTRGT